MANYCLEAGPDGELIVHKTSCGNYDLASLLGQGKVYGLGEFATSFDALFAVKRNFTAATRCLDCCRSDLLLEAGASTVARCPDSRVPIWSLTTVNNGIAAIV